MSVCRFSRPTSCRPCLTSSIALSYRILSGSAVFSALVDLLTFFFLRNTCASDRVALSRSSPIITNRVHRIVVGRNVDHLAVASNEVRRNLHLSLESGAPRHPSIRARDVPAGSPRLRTLKYSLNERPAEQLLCPFGQFPPDYPFFLMPPSRTKGCLRPLVFGRLAGYFEKYPVFVRTLNPACFGRMTIFRKVSSLPELVG